jgi:hypothetical protein
MHLYTNIDGNINGTFLETDSLNNYIGIPDDSLRIGWRTAGVLAHFSDPDYFDMVCGNFSGGLNYFSKGNAPGIRELQLDESLINLGIFPNPADMTVKITLVKNGKIIQCPGLAGSRPCLLQLFNITGKEVKRMEYMPGSAINISFLNDGMYIAELTLPGSSGTARGKLLVKRSRSN